MIKQCTKCRLNKPVSEFYRKQVYKDGYNYWCKACTKAYFDVHYANNKKAYFDRAYAHKQKKRQKIAGRPKPEFCEVCGRRGIICFDHSHKTGKFRGWLCFRCNNALGCADDNPVILQRLIDYLLKFEED